MHLPILVVYGDIVLEAFRDAPVVNDDRGLAEIGVHHYLEDVQQLPGISSALAEKGLLLAYLDIPLLQDFILLHCPLEQHVQILGLKRLQHEHLAARQEGSDDLERRVLGRGSYKHHRAGLHRTQQGVLLRLVETVDFIYEQNGGAGAGKDILLRGLDDLAHFLDSGAHRREREELPVKRVGDYARERGLADAGRAPQNERRKIARVYHVPQDAAFPHKMPLTDIFGEIFGPHPLRKRG